MKKGDYHYGLFPLRIFLFPGEQTTLHIFEPRYLQLVTECLSNNEYFGIPYQGKTTLSELGSLVKVSSNFKKIR
jgi:Lon protease-like protein